MTVKPEATAFYRGSWSGHGKKIIRNMGGNFWGPTRQRCTIIREPELKQLLEQGVAVRVPGGIRFPTPKNP